MTEDNDLLLRQFFAEAAPQQIEDNGFTEQVMRRLPVRVNWFTRLWTVLCIVVALVLFSVFHGWELLFVQLEVFLRTMPTESMLDRLAMAAAAFLGLLAVGTFEVISSEIARK